MSFELQPAGEDDIPELIAIQTAAFANDPFYTTLYQGRPNDIEVGQAIIEQTRSQWSEDPTLHAVKCVDKATGQMVGFASVKTINGSKTGGQTSAKDDTVQSRTPADKYKNKKLAAPFGEMTACIWADGEAYISFGVLAVHPAHQRLGLGTKLVQWGLKICDDAALPGYITGSPAGAGLYDRLGFRRVADVVNPAREFDEVDEELVSVAMVYGVADERLQGMKDRVASAGKPELRVV